MKIESFHIKGFKSIKDLRVDNLSAMNVFFGLNDVGKSNIFQALSLWQRAFYHDARSIRFEDIEPNFGKHFFHQNLGNTISIAVEFNLEEDEQIALIREIEKVAKGRGFLSLALLNKPSNRLSKVTATIELVRRSQDSRALELERKLSAFGKTQKANLVLDNSSKISTDLLRIVGAKRRFQVEFSKKANGVAIVGAQNLKKALFYAYLSSDLSRKQRLVAIKNILDAEPFNLGELDIALSPQDDAIDVGFIRAEGRMPLENLGDGSQQLLLILGQVFLNDYPIIILEEPEMNLSPQYQGYLLQTLRQLMADPSVKLNQLFISTHSPYLEFQENFYDVFFENGHTQITQATATTYSNHFAVLPVGPDTGSRLNSLNQVELYEGVISELKLHRGDMIYFLKNGDTGRWEVRSEPDVLQEVNGSR